MKVCLKCHAEYEGNERFCTKDGTRLTEGDAPGASLSPGEVLDGRYRITAFLGAGGMGEVYRAEHVHIVKTVAIKLLKPEITGDAEALARFKREAMLASSIGHPGIVRIKDFGELPNGRVYMAMECLEGQTLAGLFAHGAPPLPRALHLMAQVARAVAAAHDKGIVHRDLKPENVFIARQNGQETVKIVDFGIAKMRGNISIGDTLQPDESPKSNTLTREGRVFGTPYYMSPEQALGRAVDLHTDIYAMGIMLYEMVSGRVPFAEGSFLKILFMQVNEPAPPLRETCPDLPDFVESIITQALEKDPQKRQQSAHELAQQLENALFRLHPQAALAVHGAQMRGTPTPSGGIRATPASTAEDGPPEMPAKPAASRQSSGHAPAAGAGKPESPVLLLSQKIHGSRRKRRRKRIITALVVLLLAAGAGVAAWFFLRAPGDDPESAGKTEEKSPSAPLAARPVSFTHHCPADHLAPMGYAPAAPGELRESRRRTLQLSCAPKCRVVAAPAVAEDRIAATASPGHVQVWNAETLAPLWQAQIIGEITASPLVWDGRLVVAAKDRKIRIYQMEMGTPLFESPPAGEYFTASPFVSHDRVLIPGWDHSFHLVEPFGKGEPVPYTARKVPVHGMIFHPPTQLDGQWFFGTTRMLTREHVQYNFYLPVDGKTFAVKPENKARLCVLRSAPEAIEDRRILDQCPPDATLVDVLPALRAYPPLVTPTWAWFFLAGEADGDPVGLVVLCSRMESRCWQVLRAGIVSKPAAGRINNRPFGVFAMREGGANHLCGFYLDESLTAGLTALRCRWKTALPATPGDLRFMGDEIVFGTANAKILRVNAETGRILQETALSGRALAQPVRCGSRLYVGTDNGNIDIFDLP